MQVDFTELELRLILQVLYHALTDLTYKDMPPNTFIGAKVKFALTLMEAERIRDDAAYECMFGKKRK